uniref:WSC domain-containing protein n=1 Tax=Macrostomum lignano TaxID=282301 RepID=A0A1I8GFA0_9PLAT
TNRFSHWMARPTYLGCYNDDDDDDDIDLDGLSGFSQIGPYSVSNTRVTDGTAMTPELCGAICALVNFGYSGVQNNFDCYCGNSYGSLDRDLESNCNKPCAGDATKICGGSNRNSVYALTYLVQSTGEVRSDCALARLDSALRCAAKCSTRDDCQAAVFSKRLVNCHLLAFAYPPTSLTRPDWTLYVRG